MANDFSNGIDTDEKAFRFFLERLNILKKLFRAKR
ncbi:hypothetical protein P3T42_005602 [Paraburkholderia sp. GAS38]